MSAPVPLELLFGNPEKSSPRVSPDGRRLAFLAPEEGVLNLWVADGLDPSRARPVTRDRRRGVRSWFWACDSRTLLYLQDKDGDEDWHLWRADADTGAAADLTPFPKVQAQPLATDPRRPHEVLVALNRRDPRLHDVHRLDLRAGTCVLEEENPGDAVGWLADPELRVRAHRAATPDGGGALRVREPGGPWRELLRWGPDEAVGAVGFTPDGRGLYLESSLGSDATRLVEQPLDGSSPRVLAADSAADCGPVLLHPTDYRLQAVGFETDRLRWTVLDEDLRADFSALEALGEGDARVYSRDDADRIWTVLFTRDRRPPAYWLYERGPRKARFLFSTQPALDARPLAAMRPVTVPARDGLRLPCYLTLPEGVEPKDLPLVLRVHGGPWARDSWCFHNEVQWLADRGYAVLQANYRGSSGFGKRFLHAGDREWGGKMQDDLTDAARWAVREGIADPRRLAIFGGSFGGYAALCGAAFTPDLYACAVDLVGPSNILTLIRSIPPYWEPLLRSFAVRVGDPDAEPEFLLERSPLTRARDIRIPLLIAQGANDPRVKRAESEQIVAALRESGRPVEYLLFEDEGHGLTRPENRLKFYAAAERFLAKHLGGRASS
ncbi:MAG: S9 family peptidase [Elusimicrobiota bacterium]